MKPFKFITILYALLCGPKLRILINSYEDKYPIFKPRFKQETSKRAGQL